jgi:RHS repeat-associated protein
LSPVTIDYDALGRRILLTLPNGVTTEYQYDDASQLTALTYRNGLGVLGDLSYQYDPVGNRISVGGSFARTILPDPAPSATYDAANRQVALGGKSMLFDDNGNLVTVAESSGTRTLSWNTRNQLVALTTPELSGSFEYDSLGRRARRTINGLLTSFQYDGQDVVRELAGGLDVAYLRGLRLDEAFARGASEFYLADGQGGTLALMSPIGEVATQYAYAPFGKTNSSGTPSTNTCQFTGRENDGTGLYYYRARYYDPELSRFISEDPLGFNGGFNLYTYAMNDPVNFTDPSGMKICKNPTVSKDPKTGQAIPPNPPTDITTCASTQLQDCVVEAESGGRSDAVSRKGARGRWQVTGPALAELQQQGLLPRTAALNDSNLDQVGKLYLDYLLTICDSATAAVAAYNAGYSRVNEAGGIPNIPETKAYVEKIDACLRGKGLGGGLGDPGVTTKCCR